MAIIKFENGNCKNCYKCVRYCPVKAIEIKDHKAQIIEQECILCGNCTIVCPQNAKETVTQLDDIKKLLSSGAKIVADVAPSFIARYDVENFGQLRSALQKLGFADAYETAEGARLVKDEYEKLIASHYSETIISSCCPTVVRFISKRFPELVPSVAPVLSPMQAHAKYLKEKDPKIKVVFIGPCISKKAELLDGGFTDYALTFDELDEWLATKSIVPTAEKSEGDTAKLSRFFPVPGGILKTMQKNSDYNYVSVDDLESCENALREIEQGNLKNCFVEMSACKGSCIGGPVFRKHHSPMIAASLAVEKSAIDDEKIDYTHDYASMTSEPELQRTITPERVTFYPPTEQQIVGILKKMGKNSVDDELNCGTCGYPTCRDKAVAIYFNKAEISMCLPFMKERAESFSNEIIDITPNLIITVDLDLKVQQINKAACDAFGIKDKADIINFPVSRIMDEFDFVNMITSSQTTVKKRTFLTEYNIYLEQVFLFDKSSSIIICIMKDITGDRKRKSKIRDSRIAAANMADDIVDKQLRIVHEIASLLGETAAETKIAITDLKEAILMDEEE